MKKLAGVVVAMCVSAVAFAGEKPADAGKPAEAAKAAAPAKVKGEGDLVMFDNLKWEQPMGPQGPAFAFVQGDMKSKGPSACYMKFPAGFDSGWHTHDSDYTAVAIKGVMTHQVQGGVEHKITGNSYWTQPGKVNHRNVCLAEGGECIIFGSMPKGFSFTPKTAEGKDLPKDAPKGDAKSGSH